MYTSVTWTTDQLLVHVNVDARDGLNVDVGRRESAPGRRAYDLFVIDYYRAHGALTGLRAAHTARKWPRGTPTDVFEIAVALRSHDRDLLRGDLSLLDGLDEEYRRVL